MAFEVNLYAFNKKDNSTALPSGTGTKFDCNIKSVSSIMNPVITISRGHMSFTYNYAYISSFKRYYFIDDIRYDLGVWTLFLVCDVLGTYSADIKASTQYVLRSASSYDDNILDNNYVTKASVQNYAERSTSTVSVPDESLGSAAGYFSNGYDSGTFVLGVVSDNATGCSYYEFTYANFKAFVHNMMDYVPSDMSDVSSGIAKSFFDPIQYIISVKWYPVSMRNTNSLSQSVNHINLGSYSISCDAIRLNDERSKHFRATITIPKHPQLSSFSYTQLEPFSEYSLYFEPFGKLALDTTKLYNASSVNLDWYVDNGSGDAELFVKTDNGVIVESSVSNIAVNIPLSTVTIDYIGGASAGVGGVLGAIGSAFTGNIGGAINSAISGIGNTINAVKPQVSTKGAPSSYLSYVVPSPILAGYFNLQVDTAPSLLGRPLCQSKTLSTLSGYCLCSNSALTFSSLNPTSEEYRRVINYLDSGVFIE